MCLYVRMRIKFIPLPASWIWCLSWGIITNGQMRAYIGVPGLASSSMVGGNHPLLVLRKNICIYGCVYTPTYKYILKCSFLHSTVHWHTSFDIFLMDWRFGGEVKEWEVTGGLRSGTTAICFTGQTWLFSADGCIGIQLL